MTNKTGRYSIVGMVGRTGAGKESAAGILAHGAGYQQIAFGDALHIEVARAFGVDSRILTTHHLKEQAVVTLAIGRSSDPRFIRQMVELDKDLHTARTPLQIMRWWARDYRRFMDGEWYWIHRLHDTIEALHSQGHRRLVISDVQFENEAKFVKSVYGCLWRISRRQADTLHPNGQGERESMTINCDRTISNEGTLNELVYDVLQTHQTSTIATVSNTSAEAT